MGDNLTILGNDYGFLLLFTEILQLMIPVFILEFSFVFNFKLTLAITATVMDLRDSCCLK